MNITKKKKNPYLSFWENFHSFKQENLLYNLDVAAHGKPIIHIKQYARYKLLENVWLRLVLTSQVQYTHKERAYIIEIELDTTWFPNDPKVQCICQVPHQKMTKSHSSYKTETITPNLKPISGHIHWMYSSHICKHTS